MNLCYQANVCPLIEWGSLPVLKNSWISLQIEGPMVSQWAWKNAAEKPSSPGALSG